MLNIKKAIVQSAVHKRGTMEDLFEENPLLLAGELVFETNTGRSKLGDGETYWNDLPYLPYEAEKSGPIEEEINEAVRESLENQVVIFDCGEID